MLDKEIEKLRKGLSDEEGSMAWDNRKFEARMLFFLSTRFDNSIGKWETTDSAREKVKLAKECFFYLRTIWNRLFSFVDDQEKRKEMDKELDKIGKYVSKIRRVKNVVRIPEGLKPRMISFHRKILSLENHIGLRIPKSKKPSSLDKIL